MSKPCDICIDEKCEGRHDCHCNTCKLIDKCPRHLRPTIRITNRCTQECGHCCFKSHPGSNIMMTIEQSKKTAQFIRNNNIEYVNLMGGEFFCNPDWFEVMSNIVSAAQLTRIVTNGDWATNMNIKVKLSTFVSLYNKKIYFCVSKDRWHTNKNVEAAKEFLEEIGAIVRVATEEQTKTESIVPVGRAALQYIGGLYDMLACYCHNPENMYTFLIDEEGIIYKCAFGIHNYATIDEYLDGGFSKRFKEYNTKFNNVFIPSCHACFQSAYMYNGSKEYGKVMVSYE